LDNAFAEKTLQEWLPVLTRHGVWHQVVQTFEEVLEDEQAIASGAFVAPAGLGYPLVAAPFSFSCSAEHGPTHGAPTVGEHNEEVLSELGISKENIVQLQQSNILSTRSTMAKRLT
jgi:crotonobetainyl-CoA:carnitine CoA-transferase CaiB-like acyl-CoA transferase